MDILWEKAIESNTALHEKRRTKVLSTIEKWHVYLRRILEIKHERLAFLSFHFSWARIFISSLSTMAVWNPQRGQTL